jgi:hypothetical protein
MDAFVALSADEQGLASARGHLLDPLPGVITPLLQ